MDKELNGNKEIPDQIPDDIKNILRKTFQDMRDEVTIELFTKEGTNDTFNKAADTLIRTLPELTSKIKVSFHTIGDEQSVKRDVKQSPSVLIDPDKYSIRYTGAPIGEEARSFIVILLMISAGASIMKPESVEKLVQLGEKRLIEIFVSPTCPYCPEQAIFAASAAIVRPDLVSVDIIEMFENQGESQRRGVMSVPQIFMNGALISHGALSEELFIGALLTLKKPEVLAAEFVDVPVEKDLLIIGGGLAGLTAAIYAERSGLKSIVVDKEVVGGQVTVTPIVENYPGFSQISGKSLVDLIAQQALQYTEIHVGEEPMQISNEKSLFRVRTNLRIYIVKGIIVASGAKSKLLHIPGEDRLFGKGVSTCAECDGYVFRDGKKVVIIGGGNTAATYALYLHNLGAKVTIVHRRSELRSQKRLQDSLHVEKIEIIYDAEVREILGSSKVEAVKIEYKKTGEIKEMPVDGVFMAIGYEPNNEVAKLAGLKLDDYGYVVTDEKQRTSLPGVYAAGDITGSVKQIVVAVSQGALAAISAFEDIANPYWLKK
jgi:thioredoxin reductase (NADPH)